MPTRLAVAVAALVLFVALPALAELYTEWLWFGEVDYRSVFLKSLATRWLLGAVAFVAAFLVLLGNLRAAVKGARRPFVLFAGGGDLQPIVLERRHLLWLSLGASALAALFIGGVASSQWLLVLQYLEATPFGQADPLIGRDAAFYIFTLPFLEFVRVGLFAVVALALVGSAAAYVVRRGDHVLQPDGIRVGEQARRHLLLLGAAIFLLFAWASYLDMPRLLTTPAGIVHGASYVDVAVRLPVLRILMAVSVFAAGACVLCGVREQHVAGGGRDRCLSASSGSAAAGRRRRCSASWSRRTSSRRRRRTSPTTLPRRAPRSTSTWSRNGRCRATPS